MVQKEVAERFIAFNGNQQKISVLIEIHFCDIKKKFDVSTRVGF